MSKLKKGMHPSWEPILVPLLEDERYKKTQEMILGLFNSKTKFITPHVNDIYRVFSMDVSKIRVVCMGLSPYWTTTKLPNGKVSRTAIGRAFAIPYADTSNEETLSPSLKVILDALRVQYDIPELWYYNGIPFDVTLQHWEDQGVLLLNRYLTSELANNDSLIHAHYWDWFTEGVIKGLSTQRHGLIFHLWGKKAQELEQFIDTKQHYIIKASHPQASNYNSFLDFPLENVFLKTDEITNKINGEVIKWF